MGLGLIKFKRRLFDWGNSYDVESLDMGGEKITNVGAPTAGGDAVNKTYADSIAGVTDVIKADGSVKMAAALDMDSHKVTNVTDPTSAQDGATKNYTDGQIGLCVKKDGSVKMVGALDMDSHKVTNVTDPTSAQDAATKNYVDNNGGLIDARTTKILRGKVTLCGADPTTVVFGDSTEGQIMSTLAAPFDFASVGAGETLIVNPDALGNETATFDAAAGYHTGAVGASVDMSANVEDKLKVSLDGAAPVTVECDFVTAVANDGTKIAAELQTKIRAALGGALVTVAYSAVGGDHYTITSPTLGKSSSIEITPAADHDCTEELLLGTANGGVDTAGTGDVDDLSAVTAAEVIAVCTADMTHVTTTEGTGADAGKIVFTSKTVGGASSILIGAGTLSAVIGVTPTDIDYGAAGLGYPGQAMDHTVDPYTVSLTWSGVSAANLPGDNLSVDSKGATGFVIHSETVANKYDVDVLVVGVAL